MLLRLSFFFLLKTSLSPRGECDRKGAGGRGLGPQRELLSLRIGEYTRKASRNEDKQTKQFKLSDATFFERQKDGSLRRLARDASNERILAAAGATLKLDNHKNGWKGVCVHHEANGDPYFCPVKALARRYIHARWYVACTRGWSTFMSAFWENGTR